MKIFFLLIVILLFYTCTCPPCEHYPEGLRLIFVSEEGNNFLAIDSIQIDKVKYCGGQDIDFSVKDYVIPNSFEKFHLELSSETFYQSCFDQTCCILIEFSDGQVDSISYRIDIVEGERCECDTYNDSVLLYNGIDYIESQENTIGAYVITK